MSAFDRNAYGPVIGKLLAAERLCSLGPGTPNRDVQSLLDGLSAEAAFAGRRIRDLDMAAGCCSGLWLAHDYLDTSHRISQQIETADGSYWHGIMHRREPDYSNSKYWFRRVGTHPVFEPLCAAAGQLASASQLASAGDPDDHVAFLSDQSAWDPFAFIDLCEMSADERSPHETLCRRIQQVEWELLFDYCYQNATA